MMRSTMWTVRARRLVTADGPEDAPLGVREDVVLRIAEGKVDAIIPADDHLSGGDVATDLVTPGLVDAHTHAAWVGQRGEEYAMRLAGADYEAIGAAGGGIVASTRAVRSATIGDVAETLTARLRRMARLGVTTVEVKSGYGLDEASERKQLEAMARVAEDTRLPGVVPTFLGLHAVPSGEDPDAYARACAGWLDGIAADGLARFVDAYVDRNAFSVEQARPVLEKARELGLGVRAHVGQFADVGGAEMAAALGAASVDHVENISPEGVAALAEAGTAAVMLPVASFTLGQTPPPVSVLRDGGVKLVVASDANPGTAPTESLPLAMAFAARQYGMTLSEVILGATRWAALSLGLPDRGRVFEGGPADLVGWDLSREAELLQPWGTPMTRWVMRDGRLIVG